MGAIVEVKFFNSFLLKKVTTKPVNTVIPRWDGSRGIPESIGGYPRITSARISGYDHDDTKQYDWVIEESRIRGGYNNTQVSLGVRAHIVEEEANAVIRGNSLIYSGIFNSRTGINQTNVFSVGEDITKSVDPKNGTIQKLFAEDSSLIILQEDKVSRAPIDKDIIYTAEGGGTMVTSNSVIGVPQPYAGNFGISKNPESFAAYGFRQYFTDKKRGVVLRLSQNGLAPISKFGMQDFFRDEFSNLDSNLYGEGRLLGMWDTHNKQYVLSIQPKESAYWNEDSYKTLAFDEDVQGWVSFYTYRPRYGFSFENNFYTIAPLGESTGLDGNPAIWKHYSGYKSYFYNSSSNSSVTFIFNQNPSVCKNFKTINYEGSNGWKMTSFVSDMTGADRINGNWENTESTANVVLSYTEGAYDNYGNSYPSALYPPINRSGFNRKENKYFANLINNSSAAEGEIIWGAGLTGVKGYYSSVTMITDDVTDWGKHKELFAVSAEYVESSY